MSYYYNELVSSLKKQGDKKIISFSLYGEDVKYSLGAIRNVEFAKKHYPDWFCRFYCSKDAQNLEALSSLDCEILIIESKIPPMYWRFFAAADPAVKVMISRDCDSLVNSRESAAVEEWLRSDEMLHTMHDCDMRGGHQSIVMGGMWGIKCPNDIDFIKEINEFARGKRNYSFRYSDDQSFLQKIVYSKYKDSCLDHHSKPKNSKWSNSVPFPKHKPLDFGSFVGERISPFHLKKAEYINKNKDSKKIFLMPHLGPMDHIELNGLIHHLANKYEEIILPTKPHSDELVEYLFGGQKNIIIEKIKKDAQAMAIYEDKYAKTHRFLGLGNHGEKVSEKSLVKRCFIQADIDFTPQNNIFTVKSSDKSDFKISPAQRNATDKRTNKKHTQRASIEEITRTKSIKGKKTEGQKVSVLVGTFNRWNFLNKTIESIKNQTYKNIEIIVINDGSTDPDYDSIIKDVVWINLPQNSLDSHGFKCRSYVYNYGLSIAKGDYIAFCDDDDAWYPDKLSAQISEMIRNSSGMSATEAYGGRGEFDVDKKYKLYNGGTFKRLLNKKFKDGIPKFVNKDLLSVHNFLIGSSVVVKKDILDKVGLLNESRRYKKGQDYELWKRVLGLTDCIYIDKPLTYYDLRHGNGREY